MEIPIAFGPEKSVLSSILKTDGFLGRAKAEGITSEHFGHPAHAKLFGIMADRIAAGKTLELVELATALHTAGELDGIGGPGAITDVFTYAPNNEHFSAHIELLRQFLARRRAVKLASDVVDMASSAEPEDIAKALRDATEATSSALHHKSAILTAKQAVGQALAAMMAAAENGDLPGMATGLDPIDIATGGMRSGELWVVAAEPSGGKSVAMLQAACAALRAEKRVLVISLEMTAGVVITRMASCSRQIPFKTFTDPRKAGARWLESAKHALEHLSKAQLSIHDGGGLNFDQIAAFALMEAEQHGGIDLLVVDYLQLIEGSRRRRDETREQEVAAVSRGLKGLAKKLGIPVFTASQLNDQGRMRESRAIGQDADVVLVIEEDGIRGLKVRNGTRGQLFPLKLNGDYQRFDTIRPEENQAEFDNYHA